LVLASESPRRAALLAQAGIVPDLIKPAHIDETPLKGESGRACALRLARAKASLVASELSREGTQLVLAADTVVTSGQRMLPKALDGEEVRQCLVRLSGRRHQVMTGIAVASMDGIVRTRLVTTRVMFVRLSPGQIEAYVQCGEGIGKAGGYAIQGRAESFIKLINGSYSNVVGLPLVETLALLRGQSFPC
jgi:septum formation protein